MSSILNLASASELAEFSEGFASLEHPHGPVFLFEEVTSTMDVASELLSNPNFEGSAEGLVAEGDCALPIAVFARQQRSGRGRLGSAWSSEAAEGVYVTYITKLNTSAAGLSLAIGLAVHNLAAKYAVHTRLKWPNDVLVPGFPLTDSSSGPRKLAGVLLEASSTGNTLGPVLVGIGVNVKQLSFPEKVPGVSLAQLIPKPPSINDVSLELYKEVLAVLAVFSEHGFTAFREQWKQASFLLDRSMYLKPTGEQEYYLVEDVSNDGGLFLCLPSSEPKVFYSGEVKILQ